MPFSDKLQGQLHHPNGPGYTVDIKSVQQQDIHDVLDFPGSSESLGWMIFLPVDNITR